MSDEIPQGLPETNLPAPDNKAIKGSQFKIALEQIQNRPLTPDNISFYARDALERLVKLTDSITMEYATDEPSELTFGKELEDKAFAYFDLSSIGETLDYVASKDVELGQIDELVQKTEKMRHVIVPPQEDHSPIVSGDGSFKDKLVIARTKTLLFILSNDFDVKINDPEQISLKAGIMEDSMMRKLSYFMINVPGLNRTFLSCDEEGNVTYVFDNSVLNSHGLTPDDISTLTKPMINELLESDPRLGRRIVYNNRFVPRIIESIIDLESENIIPLEGAGQYLYPNAPEGVLSLGNFAKSLGLADQTVHGIVEELGDRLGEISKYRFGRSRIGFGYTPEQLEMIRGILEKRHVLRVAPDGILAVSGLAQKFGVSQATIAKAIEESRDRLGEVQEYKFYAKLTGGFNPDQQEIIRTVLESRGSFAEPAPEVIMSLSTLARRLKISDSKAKSIVERLGTTLGETRKYRFQAVTTTGYTQQQEELIQQALAEEHVEPAPEGVLSRGGLRDEFGVHRDALEGAIEELGSSLGEIKNYRFQNKITIGFTPQQQTIIRDALDKRGLFSDKAPEGVASSSSLASKLDSRPEIIAAIITELGDILGDVQSYKFGGRVVQGYTPEQQEMIKQALEQKLALETAPEGFLSFNGLGKKLGVRTSRLTRAIEDLEGNLGEIRTYRFGQMLTRGYSPEQQKILEEILRKK